MGLALLIFVVLSIPFVLLIGFFWLRKHLNRKD